jgi:hypothetical protein
VLKRNLYSLIFILTLFSLSTCIDPYTPQLKGYESILVVDGLITDENVPSEIKLSRSAQSRDSLRKMVTDAVVKISDDLGNITILTNCGGGSYKTEKASFAGEVGRTYTLLISTSDGNEYISEPCIMLPVPDIDSVYFGRDEIFSDDMKELYEGIRISVDTKNQDNDYGYFRWEVEETWEYNLPSPKKFNYINDTTIIPVDTVKEVCWRSYKPGEILTQSVLPGQSDIVKKPILFIATSKSDRLLIRYSLLVKQYSVTRKEFDFWTSLRKVNETGGNIFDTQPWAVTGNITNIADPQEKILGYFKVSAVKEKRIFISPTDLEGLGLDLFIYDCQQIVKRPSDYPTPPWGSPLTWDGLAAMFANDPKYVFIEPIYKPKSTALQSLVFAMVECSDCELKGTIKKPDFWME